MASPNGFELEESISRMEVMEGGSLSRIRVATYVWRMGRNGVRNVTEPDVGVLTSAVRSVSPPEIVVLSLCSPRKVTTGWKTQLFRALMGTVGSYVEAACIERGGSFLSIHTLSSVITPGRIIVGSFESEGRQNTVASISFGRTRLCFCNWALPRRTRENQSRIKSTYDHLAKTFEAIGSPNIISHSSHVTDVNVKHRVTSVSSRFAAAYQSILEKACLLLASHEQVVITGGIESRTTDGKDQLIQAMKRNVCLPGFQDADTKGTCITSYYDPTQPGIRALLRSDIPKGRTARVLVHTSPTETPIKVSSMRVAPLDMVSDRPVAAIIELEVHQPDPPSPPCVVTTTEDVVHRESQSRSAIIKEYEATSHAGSYFKELVQCYSRHVTERRAEQKRVTEKDDNDSENVSDSEDSGDDQDDCSRDVYIPPAFQPLEEAMELVPVPDPVVNDEDQKPEQTLLEKLLEQPSDIAHELCFDTYYPPTPASTASMEYLQPQKMLPSKQKHHHHHHQGRYPSDPSECSSGQVSSLTDPDRYHSRHTASPSYHAGSSVLKHGAYSPTYYLPPAFTLLWSVSREAVAEGLLESSAIEDIAAATLYNEEHWSMLYERGKLAAQSKNQIRERVLQRREQHEMSQLRQKPQITKTAKELPSRGDFFGYTDEWKKRSEVERKLKEDLLAQKEEKQFKDNIAKMSENSARIMSNKKNYKSPVADWAHHAIDHFSRKHPAEGPGGVFEPVINQRSYDLGKTNRGTLQERNAKRRKEVERRLNQKREEFSEDIDPETGKKFTHTPKLSDNAHKINTRGFEAMYNGWQLNKKQRQFAFKKKYDDLGRDECPFAPELDPRSLRIMENRPHVEVHERQPSPSRRPKKDQKPKVIRLTEKQMKESAKRMSEATELRMRQNRKKNMILESRKEEYSYKPEVNPKSTQLVKARLATVQREEAEKPPPPVPNSVSRVSHPDQYDEDLPAYPAAARSLRGKTRSVSPNQYPRPLTSGTLIQRPRKGTYFEYGSPSRSPMTPIDEGVHRRNVSTSRSASQEFYTPLRSSTSVPWLVPQDAIPVTISDTTTGGGSQRMSRAQPRELSPAQQQLAALSPFSNSQRAANQDPYGEIEKHLYTMCGVLDDYKSLEDYASTLSAV
eukprot:TRINITY_DN12622_c0_g1_i2.p1 TRINITY_DN12622_c0_g1~~TRINITY_DN12622_c0_g1_i2.p1  ORF type:complete len:1134 (+),score=202.86 TRINITY_DN12622_c0_g1_i2:61-3462(+)